MLSPKSRQLLTALFTLPLLALAAQAQIAQVGYSLENLGAGQWSCCISVDNLTFAQSLKRFILWFPPDLYQDLVIDASPAGWDTSVEQPDPFWLDYGSFRAAATADGIAPNGWQGGFALHFTYLGAGTPAPLEYDIVDPLHYISLESGFTLREIWVDAAATSNFFGTEVHPFKTIASALTAAENGWLIKTRPGTYRERLNFNTKAVTLQSVNPRDWNTIAATIIDAQSNGSCVTFNHAETSASVLDGLTLTHGNGTYDSSSMYSPTGGGVYVQNASPTIRRCYFTLNGYNSSNGTNNLASGGGIAIAGATQALITDCLFTGNATGLTGSAIYLYSSNPTAALATIRNCTIADNRCVTITSQHQNYEVNVTNTRSAISNCIIYSLSDRNLIISDPNLVSYSCIRQAYQYTGNYSNTPLLDLPSGHNIVTAPRFVNGYHLAPSSPCRNAGDPNDIPEPNARDFDGQPRLMGDRIDIGIDELPPSATVTSPATGAVWTAGSQHSVTWQSFDLPADVNLSLSTDNGATWSGVTSTLPNTGSVLWQVPLGIDANQCFLKVESPAPLENASYTPSGSFAIHPYTPAAPAATDWPTLAQNFQRTGLADANGPEIGCLNWQFAGTAQAYSSITLGAAGRIHMACDNGQLHTLDPNGQLLWTFDANTPFLSAPTVGPDGTLYVGALDRALYAIDPNGRLRWKNVTAGLIHSSPAVAADGTVYVGSADGKLYAFGHDGSDRWAFATGATAQMPGMIMVSPTLAPDGTIYVPGVYNSTLYALNPADASVTWSHNFAPADANSSKISGYCAAAPVVAPDGTIYVVRVNDPNLYALNPANGSVAWQTNLVDPANPLFNAAYKKKFPRAAAWAEPALAPDGTIYVTLDDPYLRAVAPGGAILWIARLGDFGGFTLAVGADGLIYAASDDGTFYVVSPDGETLAAFDGVYGLSYPVIAPDGTLYLLDQNKSLWALSRAACAPRALPLHRPADVTADGLVDLQDFARLAANWLACSEIVTNVTPNPCPSPITTRPYLPADIDRNRYVNLADLALLAFDWLIVSP